MACRFRVQERSIEVALLSGILRQLHQYVPLMESGAPPALLQLPQAGARGSSFKPLRARRRWSERQRQVAVEVEQHTLARTVFNGRTNFGGVADVDWCNAAGLPSDLAADANQSTDASPIAFRCSSDPRRLHPFSDVVRPTNLPANYRGRHDFWLTVRPVPEPELRCQGENRRRRRYLLR